MATVTATDVDIAYRVEGSGEPVLLIAGTGYPGTTWHPDFVSALARDFAVVTFDHRGTGSSTAGVGPYTTRQLAQDALAVLSDVGGCGHVVGHSMGGRVAQWLAVQSPESVASLVVASSGPGAAGPADPTQVGIPVPTVLGLLEHGYSGQIAAVQRRSFFTDAYAETHSAMVEWLHAAFWAGHPPIDEYLKHVQARQAHDARAEAATISCPTLVVVGDLDRHRGATGSHYDQALELHRLIPRSEFVVLPGLRHGIFWQGIDESVALLRSWFGRSAPPHSETAHRVGMQDTESKIVDTTAGAAGDLPHPHAAHEAG